MPYEQSEIRRNLFKYMAQIGDILTTKADVRKYEDYTNALRDVADKTDELYTPDADGNFPDLTEDSIKSLKESYNKLMDATGKAAEMGDGPLAEQMSGIMNQISGCARRDLAALEAYDPQKEMTLPEVIEKGRSIAVDIGDQELSSSSGQMSLRIPIDVQLPDGREHKGFFTQTATLDTRKELNALTERMGEKYPDYKELFDTIKNADLDKLSTAQVGTLEGAYSAEGPGIDSEGMINTVFTLGLMEMGVPNDMVNELSKRQDFVPMMDELTTGLDGPLKARSCYAEKEKWLGLEEGCNIDKRNAAMSSVSALLGKPGLVAHAEPMIVMVNGKAVTGTFMDKAEGIEAYNIKEKDKEVKDYGPEHYDNPAVFDDIAGIQAIDYICGNVDRHEGNFFMNFDKDTKKLVGITAIDNDLSFMNRVPDRNKKSGIGNKWVAPSDMGVIGEDMANRITAMTEESLSVALQGYGLSKDEISAAWGRTKVMQDEIKRGMEHYKDKAPGELDRDFLRVVPKNQWDSYNLKKLAKMGANQFKVFSDMKRHIMNHDAAVEKQAEWKKKADARRGLKEQPKVEAPSKGPAKAKPIGTGMKQNYDPMGVNSPETIKVALKDGETLGRVGGAMSSRNPISYMKNGKEVNGFFTEGINISIVDDLNRLIDNTIKENPEYSDDMEVLRRHFKRYDAFELNGVFMGGYRFKEEPVEDMGFDPKRLEELKNDKKFIDMVYKMGRTYGVMVGNSINYTGILGASVGSSIPKRNVAMSQVGDLLGTPDILARSTTMQLQVGDRIVDGVFMEAAEGVDRDQVRPEDAAASYGEEVYNNGPGLKSLAELQVLDYICMNGDRHGGNMFYNFSKGPNPKFMGVTGIDNDLSFGTVSKRTNERVQQDTALDDMDMISERMAERIKKVKPDDLKQTLKDQGLSRQEILAAQERLVRVQNRIEDGRMRIVPEKEWDNMKISELAAKGKNIFRTVHESMVVDIKATAERRRRLDLEDGGRSGPLKFAKSDQVNEFSEAAVENTTEKQGMIAEEADFEKEMLDMASKYQEAEARSDADIYKDARQAAKDIYKALDGADPALMRSSKYYREMKQEANELRKLTNRIDKRMGKNGEPTAEETAEVMEQLGVIRAKAAEYEDYKLDQVMGDENSLNKTESKRIAAARSVAKTTNGLLNSYSNNQITRQQQLHGQRSINQVIANCREEIDAAGKTPAQVEDLAATMICAKALNVSDRRLGKKVATALSPERMKNSIEWLKKDPGFKALAAQGNKKLIAMAKSKGGEGLYRSFLRERNKSKQLEKTKTIQKKTQKDLNKNTKKQNEKKAQGMGM